MITWRPPVKNARKLANVAVKVLKMTWLPQKKNDETKESNHCQIHSTRL